MRAMRPSSDRHIGMTPSLVLSFRSAPTKTTSCSSLPVVPALEDDAMDASTAII
jgi:hypothetical protein